MKQELEKEIKENCKHSLSICVVCGKEVDNKKLVLNLHKALL